MGRQWLIEFVKDHPLYYRWIAIRQRCQNPRHPRYADWGGRGIRVCHRWQTFALFELDVMKLPNAMVVGYTLDRIDNDGHYEPGNVRWSTAAEQRHNQYRRPWPFGVLDYEKDDAKAEAAELEAAEADRLYREANGLPPKKEYTFS